jgi:choline monooxygenase
VTVAARTRTLPYTWYCDEAVARLEAERVFASAWQYVGHAGQVAEPGQFTTGLVGWVPVVTVRGRDGELRAFVNVCRHRGFPVCEGDGRRETIQCPYHAWTYDLDGSLRSAPRADREPDFDRSQLGLVPAAVDTWGPFVFVNPDAGASPLADHLGALPELVRSHGLDVDELEFSFRWEVGPYEANWKVILENFLECYHCTVAHPSLAKAIDVSADGYLLETHGTFSSQLARARDGGGGVYDASGVVERGQFHLVLPNTTINVMPGRPNLSIGPVVPLTAERTDRYLDYFFAPGTDEAWRTEFLELDSVVGAEDRVLVERLQRGLRSRAVEHGRLMGESERLIAHFQAYVVEALGAEV